MRLRRLGRHRRWGWLLVGIGLPLLVYRSHHVAPDGRNFVDRAIWRVTSPVEKLLSSVVEGVAGHWRSYVALRGAQARAAECSVQLRRAQAEATIGRTWQQEIARLERALRLHDELRPLAPISGRVVAWGTSPSRRIARIDVGIEDGVEVGTAVVQDEGLVGYVQSVGWQTAEVRVIDDAGARVHVFGMTSRTLGRVRGRGAGRAVVRPVGVALFEEGELLLTSGLGGLFPRGIPVGRVARPRAQAEDMAVELDGHLDRIDVVQLVKRPEPQVSVATPGAFLPKELMARTGTGSEARNVD